MDIVNVTCVSHKVGYNIMFHTLFWFNTLHMDEQSEANQLKLHLLCGGSQNRSWNWTLPLISLFRTLFQLIWVVAFSAVVLIGVDYGLAIGVIFAVFTVVVRTQHPQYSIMGKIPGTDIYRDTEDYEMVSRKSHEWELGWWGCYLWWVHCGCQDTAKIAFIKNC